MYGGSYGNPSYGMTTPVYYVVRPGDTLTTIAARFGTTVGAILAANPVIYNPNLIYAGQTLLIPAGSAAMPYPPSMPPMQGYPPQAPYPPAPYPPPAMTPAPAPPPAATPTPAPGQPMASINLTAQNMAFSLSTITVPAGALVTVHFTNLDPLPHNFAVFTNSSLQQVIFRGQVIMGPNATATYQFTAPSQPGTYFFHCDVHPTVMMGQFVVQ
jgi:plastocyanin